MSWREQSINVSNKVRLGNTAVTVVEGQVAYSFPSDGRFKFNVEEKVPGLAFIQRLRPVVYQFDFAKYNDHIEPDEVSARIEENELNKKRTEETQLSKIIH